jgi:RimJ/RimL family protein N-acetyltransferase
VEIGYGVSPEWEGRGIATAIAKGMCDIAFGQNATAVIAHTLPDGFASQRVLEKAGFQRIGMVVDPEDGQVLQFRRNRPTA